MHFLSWFGITLVALGIGLALNEHRIISSLQITEGTLLSVKIRPEGRGTVCELNFQFKTRDGHELAINEKSMLSPVGVQAGDSVMVAYPPDHPLRAKTLLFGSRYAIYLWIVGAGLLMLFGGLGSKYGESLIHVLYQPS